MLTVNIVSDDATIRNVRISTSIDDALRIWVNGHEVTNGWVAHVGSIGFDAPDGYFVPGENLIAVHARDWGGHAFFDMKIDADCTCKQQTESEIYYRLVAVDDQSGMPGINYICRGSKE